MPLGLPLLDWADHTETRRRTLAIRDRRGERPLPRANAGFADGQQRQLTDSTGTYRPR